MARTKIAVIGAATSVFGPKLLRDMAYFKDLRGSQLALMDINTERLDIYGDVARRVSAAAGVDYDITTTSQRRQALAGAEFVIISFAISRNRLWQEDFDVPLSHGIKHVYGECGGPGALFHTLRNVPVLLEIARDIEAVCPDARVMVITNPEARLGAALEAHTALDHVGLCHGVEIIIHQRIARLIDVPADVIEVTAAGINHFTWILSMTHRQTGEDLLPAVKKAFDAQPHDFEPLTRAVWERFGVLPSPGDKHIGEYLSFAWEFCGLEGPQTAGRRGKKDDRWATMRAQAAGEAPLDEYLQGRSWADTLAFPLIDALVNGNRRRMPALNVANRGYISNLPEGAIVEVPAWVDGSGVQPERIGELPAGIAALCRRELDVRALAVEAAVTGSRALALQTLLVDPVVWSMKAAEATLDDMLKRQAQFLPQFT